jgi:hypothetical protein
MFQQLTAIELCSAASTPGIFFFAGGVLAPNYMPACENRTPTMLKMSFIAVTGTRQLMEMD